MRKQAPDTHSELCSCTLSKNIEPADLDALITNAGRERRGTNVFPFTITVRDLSHGLGWFLVKSYVVLGLHALKFWRETPVSRGQVL